MALSKRSLLQAKEVLKQILESGTDVIVTRSTLDIKIEIVKFPWLKSSHDRNPRRQTIYVSKQYDPIRYWMVTTGFLRQEYSQNKYWYYVNKEAIRNYLNHDLVPSKGYSTKRQSYMTKKEKTFQHIEANGNAMKYTDIIKFVYELNNGKGTFNKKDNRGYYSCAFRKYATYRNGMRIPDGHFVKDNPEGYLYKTLNGLWAVCRPGKQQKPIETEKKNYLPKEEYDGMCEVLRKYNIDPYQFDNLASKYWSDKSCDVNSAYHFAYYDLLEKVNVMSDTTKSLQKEIEAMIDRIDAEEKIQKEEKNYMIVWKTDQHDIVQGTFTEKEVATFFEDRNIEHYYVIEIARRVIVEKKITTTISIK